MNPDWAERHLQEVHDVLDAGLRTEEYDGLRASAVAARDVCEAALEEREEEAEDEPA